MRNEAMSLLDRYIYAVRQQLPRAKRDDIASELREILQSQVDDEETIHQRPLTDTEIGQILKKYGHPRDVAASYGSRQYLIGPEAFPSYLVAIKIVAWIMAAVTAFMVLTTVVLADEKVLESVAETIWTMVSIGLFNLALVTVSFACLGRVAGSGMEVDWDIDDLPDEIPGSPKPVERSEIIGSLVGMLLLLCWWLGLNNAMAHWFGWGPLPFTWTPVWVDVSYVAIAVIVAAIGRELTGLLRPQWMHFYVAAGVVLDLVALAVLWRLLSAGTFLVASNTAAGGSFQALVFLLDKFIFVLLLLITLGTVVGLVRAALRLLQMSRPGLGTA
jgi:hypothetical protein